MLHHVKRFRALLAPFAAAAMLGGCAYPEDLKPAVDLTIEATPDRRPSFRLNVTIPRSIEPADMQAKEPGAPAAQPSQTH